MRKNPENPQNRQRRQASQSNRFRNKGTEAYDSGQINPQNKRGGALFPEPRTSSTFSHVDPNAFKFNQQNASTSESRSYYGEERPVRSSSRQIPIFQDKETGKFDSNELNAGLLPGDIGTDPPPTKRPARAEMSTVNYDRDDLIDSLTSQLENLQTENKGFQTQLKNYQNQIDQLTHALDKERREKQQLEMFLTEQGLDDNVDQRMAREEKVNALQSQLDVESQTRKRFQDHNKQLVKVVKDTGAKLNQAKQQLEENARLANSQQQEIQRLKAELKGKRNDEDSQVVIDQLHHFEEQLKKNLNKFFESGSTSFRTMLQKQNQ